MGATPRWYHVDFLRDHVGHAGEVVSFDSIAEHTRNLRSKAAGNEAWRICDFALGQGDSKASLNIMRSGDLPSSLRPHDEWAPLHWGNRACAIANLEHWATYNPLWHSLENDPRYPVQVWAFAMTPAAGQEA